MAEEEPLELPKHGNGKLIVIVVGLNVAVLAGVGGYLMLGGSESASADAPAEDVAPEDRFGPLFEMRPIVVNLSDRDAGRYIKVTPFLETASDSDVSILEAAEVPLRNRLIVYFSDVTVEATLGSERKTRIQGELKDIINELMGAELVRNVFFSEFVIQ